jgi:hypothetical protein
MAGRVGQTLPAPAGGDGPRFGASWRLEVCHEPAGQRQTIHLGDGAYARWDFGTGAILFFTDRSEISTTDDTMATKRHWVSLEPDSLREFVAFADKHWPGWRKP